MFAASLCEIVFPGTAVLTWVMNAMVLWRALGVQNACHEGVVLDRDDSAH
jgi:hypothetical protein